MSLKYRKIIIEVETHECVIDAESRLKERSVYSETSNSSWEMDGDDRYKNTTQFGEHFVFDRGVKYNIPHDTDFRKFNKLMRENPELRIDTLLSWMKL